jgi:glutamate synthase (NADPH/NADH) small chain
MANPTGFLEYPRVETPHRSVQERIADWREIDMPLTVRTLRQQAARCMDCAVPYCHAVGCPVRNRIPEFNDLVYRDRWREAAENLHSTNNFPEITGRVCPAPCEAACTLNLHAAPVNIKHVEYQIAERAFREGWVRPLCPQTASGRRVAVIGSGPAGLAAAQQLARAGHAVVLFEKDDRPGGLLRYGIPDFKLEKPLLDQRLAQMAAEGVKFEPGVAVGADISARYLRRTFDAVCLTMGSGQPRPLDAPGADLEGVHYAMDFLTQQNRRLSGDPPPGATGGLPAGAAGGWPAGAAAPGPIPRLPGCAWHSYDIHAQGKRVVVIGGGDTGSDCVGTALRQGAASVDQLEILPRPPDDSNPETPWPMWPKIMRTSSSQEEGCTRRWSTLTTSLSGCHGRVAELHCCEVDWVPAANGFQPRPRPGSDFTLQAELVLLAMGFLHVVHAGLIEQLGITLSNRGNVVTRNWMTSQEGVFAAGDTVRGASLVVHAINEGRLAAAAIDAWLRR